MRCLLFFLLFLVCANSFAAICNSRQMCVWPNNKLPVNFVMDNANIAGFMAPNNLVPNNTATRSYLVDQLKTWNGDGSYFIAGSLVGSISIGNVNPRPFEKNGVNEISFSYWDIEDFGEDAIGIAYAYIHNSAKQKTPYSPRTSIITEADIYIKPTRSFYIGSTPPSGCDDASNQQMNIETLLKHEMGHALGHGRHRNPPRILASYLSSCNYEEVTNEALESISEVYPSKINIDIDIQSPTKNQVLIINQQNTFSANIIPLSSIMDSENSVLSKKQLKNAEDSMVWTSSVDGEIGVGSSISPLLLTGGEHELTVTIGEPGDAVYGESFSSYFVIDTISDIVDSFGVTMAYPFPCVRSVARSDNACLFTVLDSVNTAPNFLDGCAYKPTGLSRSSPPYSEDYQPTGQSIKFDLHIEPLPKCNILNFDSWEYYAYTSWVYDAITTNTVDFHLHIARRTAQQDPSSIRNVWFYNMPLVDPGIYVDPPGDCNITDVTAKCGVDINWSDKYFLPDAGVFYKPNGSANWTLVRVLSEDNAGSVNTGNIIGVDGGQIAIFQYSKNVYTPNSDERIISAPSGQVAGPFAVYALMPPPSGTLTANDSTCIIPLGKTKCSIGITLTKADTPWACAWFADTGKLKACTSGASRTFTSFTTTESCCDFVLKAHDIKPRSDPRWDGNGGPGTTEIFNEGLVLDTLSVRGIPETQATGVITSDSPCQLAPGNTNCTVQLEYQKSDTPWACVWTQTNTVIGCTDNDSLQVKDWRFTTVTSKTLELRAHLTLPSSVEGDRLAGEILDTVSVYAQTTVVTEPTGSISSPDSPCTLQTGETNCTVQINYQKSDTPWACVWTQTNKIIACTSYDSPQIKDWRFATVAAKTIELRAHLTRPISTVNDRLAGTLLDSISIYAQEGATSGPSGSINAPDSPCTLPVGETKCTVTLEYQKINTPYACVWTPSRTKFTCFTSDALQTKDWRFTTSTGMTLELRAHDSLPPSSLAGYLAGVYLDNVFVKAN